MEELTRHLVANKLDYELIGESQFRIDGKTYELVLPRDGRLFDDDFRFVLDDTECDNFAFRFGGDYYWIQREAWSKPRLNELRYLGSSTSSFKAAAFLGVHGAYEILNGSRPYEDWCQKALFMGVQNLGIAEKNTLAGALKFQLACQKAGIKSILGATYTVQKDGRDVRYDVKCYARNAQGWENILLMNKEVNVVNNKFILESRLLELTAGVTLVMDPKSLRFEDIGELVNHVRYYQLDSVQYTDNARDEEYLVNLRKFAHYGKVEPIAICDAFYLDSDHAHIKKLLNGISGVRELESDNQYMKDAEDHLMELDAILPPTDAGTRMFTASVENLLSVATECDFAVDVSKFNMPDYMLTDAQRAKFKDVDDLFWYLVEKGLSEKVPDGMMDEYLARVDTEYQVISQGEKFIDYLLILWDIIDYCDRNRILVGYGRGSSGGSLIAFLLGITNVDPIKYGLLFERFLNENRVKKSLPDIDTDFEGARRDEVKHYMEQRFGGEHVCSVGTYGNLKLKMAFTDLGRLAGIPIPEIKAVTAILGDGELEGTDWSEIFSLAANSKRLREFIADHPDVVHDTKLCIMQPRSASVHACATIITPNNKDIFRWFPVKRIQVKDQEDVLISEWEGIQLDKAGFLKEDILGLLQLDKFSNIMRLIKENRGIAIDFKKIPLEDKATFDYFGMGWNCDVFQFGTNGLRKYTRELKPDCMDELSATNALYRPGAMKSNAHNEFVLIKNGEREATYDHMLEEVTKSTYGLYVYQEQIMMAAKVLGGMTLAEADTMRKIMLGAQKKQQRDQFYIYRGKFVSGAMENGCGEKEAEEIWDKLEAFAGYGFNKSHAMAYSIMAYISQWFKVNYPIEFWTTAFKLSKEELVSSYISEIAATGAIKISPPDINGSELEMTSSYSENTIYWGLSSVKGIGKVASEQLTLERAKNGRYFSLEEFVSRHTFKDSGVNKTHIEGLIYSGAFDRLENVSHPMDRRRLIDLYRKMNKVKVKGDRDVIALAGSDAYEPWWWVLQQRRLSGIATFNYEEICDKYLKSDYTYISQAEFQEDNLQSRYYGTGGIVVEVKIRSASKKGSYCSIVIESNCELLRVTIFPDMYARLTSAGMEFVGSEGRILVLSGMFKLDDFYKENTMKVWERSEVVLLG